MQPRGKYFLRGTQYVRKINEMSAKSHEKQKKDTAEIFLRLGYVIKTFETFGTKCWMKLDVDDARMLEHYLHAIKRIQDKYRID